MRPILYSIASLMSFSALAQSGSLDTGFDPMDLSGGTADGLNAGCHALAVQPDGKVLVGGGFTTVNGVERAGIARMNTDGSLDLEFDPGYGANASVQGIALQADGKVLVGGMFTYFNGQYCNHIIRLHADGSVDEGFNTGNGFDGNVRTFLVQADGKVLVGGDFYQMSGEVAQGLVRLNADGSRDTSFDGGNISHVYTLSPMSGDRVLVGGLFSIMAGVERQCIAAIDQDGGVDASFAPVGWSSSPVFALQEQGDGKVLAGGMMYGGIARMEANGEPDPYFGSGISGFSGWDPWVYALAVQADGGILCAGRFTSYNGTPCNGMARLNPDGSLDPTFDIGAGFDGEVFAMVLQTDGRALAGGYFNTVNGTPRNRIARVFAEELSTAVAPTNDLSLAIYPNPSAGEVFIRTDGRATERIRITGPDGRSVSAPIVPAMIAGVQRIDLGAYAKGVYLVHIADGLSAHTERVVVR